MRGVVTLGMVPGMGVVVMLEMDILSLQILMHGNVELATVWNSKTSGVALVGKAGD